MRAVVGHLVQLDNMELTQGLPAVAEEQIVGLLTRLAAESDGLASRSLDA